MASILVIDDHSADARAQTHLLTDQLAAKNDQLAALLDVSQRLAAEHDPSSLLQIGCDAARTIIGATYAVLDLRAADQLAMRHFHTSGLSAEKSARLCDKPVDHKLVGKLRLASHPLRVPDMRGGLGVAGLAPFSSFLGVPIMSATWRYGILYLTDKRGAAEFSADDEHVATLLAAQVALAYESAQRYGALQRSAAALVQEIAERRHVEAQRDQQLAQVHLARAVAERAAQRIVRLQAMTAACSEALTLEHVTEVVIDQLTLPGASAGLIALLTDDHSALQIVRAYGYPFDTVAEWSLIPLDAAIPLTAVIHSGEAIWLESTTAFMQRYPQLAALASSGGSRALVALPLIAHGQVIGSMGLSFTEERAFDAEERGFMLALAQQYAQEIERTRLYQTTQAAAKRTEEALALLESVLQAAPVGFAFLDDQLRYLMINTNLAALNREASNTHLGRTISDVLPELGPILEPLLRTVLATGVPLLNKELSGTLAGTKRRAGPWLISSYLVRTGDGEVLGVGVILNDISARKRAEDRQATQMVVTRIIAESENRYDAIPALLAAICRSISWDLGEFWQVNSDASLLSWGSNWRDSDVDDSAFVTTSHASTFARGVGLPGRVWASGQPEWVATIVAASLPRTALARAAGFHSAFGFPILGGGTVRGVMTFFCRERYATDPDLLITMTDIGSQIGQFFERVETEERLWQHTQRLKIMHVIDQAMLAAQAPEAIAQAALRHMRALVPCRAATVTTFDFTLQEATVVAVETSAAMPFQRGTRIPLSALVSLSSLQQGQSSIVDDLHDFSIPTSLHEQALKAGIRSYMSVPIMLQHTLIGVLNLLSDRPRAFVPEYIDIVHEVCSQLAVAIHNAQLFEQVRAGAESLRRMSQQLVRAQEDERQHIARELHDEVGQSLTAVLLNLQMVVNLPDPSELPARLEDSMAQIERVLQQIRTLSLSLRPALLDDLGLAPALRWLVSRQSERAGFDMTFQANSADPMDERFATDIETTCFRVVQEALTNIVRYAQAQRVTVELLKRGAELCVSIRDDGVGFDVAAALQRAAHGHSMGLLSMQERVLLLGGRMRIESAPGQGALIDVCLPLVLPAVDLPARVRSSLL